MKRIERTYGPVPRGVYLWGRPSDRRCSTCKHGPAVGCKLIKECGNGKDSKWEGKK